MVAKRLLAVLAYESDWALTKQETSLMRGEGLVDLPLLAGLAMQAYYHEEGDTPRMLKKNVSDVRRLTAPPSKRVKTIDEESGAITVTVNAGQARNLAFFSGVVK